MLTTPTPPGLPDYVFTHVELAEMKSYCLCSRETHWHEILKGNIYDVYHLPEYVAVDARLTEGKAIAVCVEEGPLRLFVPLVLEPVPEFAERTVGLSDAHSPYGYASPLMLTDPDVDVSEDQRERFLAAAVPRLRQELKSLGIVSAFIRLHPLLPLPLGPLACAGDVVERGYTVSVDLTLPEEELQRQLRKDHQRDIRNLERDGYVASIEEDLSEFDTFRDIYIESMNRLGASEYYYFNDEYFRSMREELAPYVRLGAVRHKGVIVSMDLFTEVNGIIQGHLRGTRTEHVRASPAKALTVETQRWAKARGNWVFHLGGGIGSAEQRKRLMKYKLGFSPRKHMFRTWHLIIRPDEYNSLAEEWQRTHVAQVCKDSEYFPIYRTPLSG